MLKQTAILVALFFGAGYATYSAIPAQAQQLKACYNLKQSIRNQPDTSAVPFMASMVDAVKDMGERVGREKCGLVWWVL